MTAPRGLRRARLTIQSRPNFFLFRKPRPGTITWEQVMIQSTVSHHPQPEEVLHRAEKNRKKKGETG
ncbi:MAG: hypothetical protein ACE15F_09285 [bacterium]